MSCLLCSVIAFCVLTITSSQLAGQTHDSKDSNQPAPKWGSAKTLVTQLEAIKEIPQATMWATETLEVLEALSQTQVTSHAEIGAHLVQLQNQRNKISQLASLIWSGQGLQAPTIDTMRDASELSRIGYRIDRRMAIWQHIAQPLALNSKLADQWGMRASFSQISFDQLPRQWVDYLLLREFKKTFGAIRPSAADQQKVSREILARIYSPVLKPDQRAFISEAIDPSIIQFLKQHASVPVDPAKLLKHVELYESFPSAAASQYLNDDYQNLLWSNDPAHVAIANSLQSHYRNANFRITVSSRLLNRMIPDMPASAVPVSETIQGAQVSGKSHIKNRVRVALEPNATQMVLRLETDGRVQADTVARTNTFRVFNQGQANFVVHKRILIGTQAIDSSQGPYSSTSANQNVVGLESKLDNLPLLGWMARRLAENKLRGDATDTNRMFQEKVRSTAETTVEQQVEMGLAKFRHYAYTNLFQPLMAMDLDPEAIQMASTSNQVMMRYRIAGRDQMAANSARPRDSGNSLLSFQMHQSAINNAIARIGLNGNTFTTNELKMHLAEVLGTTVKPSEPDDKQAEIGFAKHDPIKLEFAEDRLNITLSLTSLKIGEKGKKHKNIRLTASYKIQTNGMQVALIQDDDGTRIKGAKKRMKLFQKAAIGTVMKVLFEKQYVVNAIPKTMSDRIGGQQLTISQLVLSDGWIGVSLDDAQPQFYQSQIQNQPTQRVGVIRRLMNRR